MHCVLPLRVAARRARMHAPRRTRRVVPYAPRRAVPCRIASSRAAPYARTHRVLRRRAASYVRTMCRVASYALTAPYADYAPLRRVPSLALCSGVPRRSHAPRRTHALCRTHTRTPCRAAPCCVAPCRAPRLESAALRLMHAPPPYAPHRTVPHRAVPYADYAALRRVSSLALCSGVPCRTPRVASFARTHRAVRAHATRRMRGSRCVVLRVLPGVVGVASCALRRLRCVLWMCVRVRFRCMRGLWGGHWGRGVSFGRVGLCLGALRWVCWVGSVVGGVVLGVGRWVGGGGGGRL